jgi:hypothetical protein
MPVASLVHQIVQGLVGRGYGEQDFAALIELEAQSAGLRLVGEDAEVSDGLEPPDGGGSVPGGTSAGGGSTGTGSTGGDEAR